MRVNREKTEYLRVAANAEEQREGAAVVRRVEEFMYLGSTVQADGGSEKEVVKRIQAGWGAWKKITELMCDRRVPEMVKGRMYKTTMRPTMMYGREAVAGTRKQEEKMQVAETKMLRWSLGLKSNDRIRDERVRKRVAVGELRVKRGQVEVTTTEQYDITCNIEDDTGE
ncbi:uncharacterized protein LOC122251315 [Penaeus japonicus]|uniref:uncharacterized protein LOC122251315 n=1 Tax=Penaeus japonicus TaxID=27405 RepID=UPI001C713A32|nr:uncharacterized protein LOC122251315 [Penaeus japonicus]